jgi:hypothetical protein
MAAQTHGTDEGVGQIAEGPRSNGLDGAKLVTTSFTPVRTEADRIGLISTCMSSAAKSPCAVGLGVRVEAD